MLTETASSVQFAPVMMALVTSSASFAFCCSDLPAYSFTITWGISPSFRSEFLARRPEYDFVDVHIFRLAEGEGNRPHERVSRDCGCRVELTDPRQFLVSERTVAFRGYRRRTRARRPPG